MGKREVGDLFKRILNAAGDEARLRGDRRIGTDHLLLALLGDPASTVPKDLGVTRHEALAVEAALDVAALDELGIGILGVWMPEVEASGRRLPPLSSGSREVIKETFNRSKPKTTGRLSHRDFLQAILAREAPDPAAELLAALKVDTTAVRSRLASSRL